MGGRAGVLIFSQFGMPVVLDKPGKLRGVSGRGGRGGYCRRSIHGRNGGFSGGEGEITGGVTKT